MENTPLEPRDILGQLAREYSEKFAELEEILKTAEPEHLKHQLEARAELTTSRFRAAQFALFDMLMGNAGNDPGDIVKAATALCSCYDELHILFQTLQDYSCRPENEQLDEERD